MLPTIAKQLDLASCLPALPGVDWSLVAPCRFVFVGTGAVNRPLTRQLAWLGMKQCLLIDPKRYKDQSVISQCEPHEVGLFKAEVLARELQAFGVAARALVQDIDAVPPGYLEENSLVVLAVDNRRADICANRWAARMRAPIVKINVEPAYLTASIRCYDLRPDPPGICVECQMTDRHYEQQMHPLSCDGGGTEQATGSPRPLSQLAANAGALAIAQIVASPDHWANAWWGKQWQQNLLGGQASISELHPNPHCRWNHSQTWGEIVRLSDAKNATLSQLAAQAGFDQSQSIEWEFSGRIASKVVCSQCQQPQEGTWWIAELDKPAILCQCGGEAYAIPFYTHQRLSAAKFSEVWEKPLDEWGLPAGSVLRVSSGGKSQSFCVPVDRQSPENPVESALESLF